MKKISIHDTYSSYKAAKEEVLGVGSPAGDRLVMPPSGSHPYPGTSPWLWD